MFHGLKSNLKGKWHGALGDQGALVAETGRSNHVHWDSGPLSDDVAAAADGQLAAMIGHEERAS
jgi:hypothetical protein